MKNIISRNNQTEMKENKSSLELLLKNSKMGSKRCSGFNGS
jgi:hypothetical protein